MASKPPTMTPAEFQVMKALWRVAQGSVSQIRAEHVAMFESDLAYTTVMTLLNRLAAKGAVLVDRSSQPFVYRAAHRRESVLRERLRSFLETVFDGRADSLVLQLLEDESLSAEQLRRIESQIAAAEGSPDDEEPS